VINPLPIVRAELRRTRAATLAAVALVAVAVALGVAVTAQERALRAGTARAADPFDVLIGARGSPTQLVLSTVYLQPAPLDLLPDPALAQLDAEPGIAWAAPIAFGDSYRGFPVVGTTTVLATHGGTSLLSRGRVFHAAGEAVVGADVPLRLDERFSPMHGEARAGADHEGVEHGFEYTVVGVRPRLGTPWDRAILVPVEAVWRVHARPNGHGPGVERIGPPWDGEMSPVSALAVKAASVADAYRLRARHRTPSTMALFPAEVLVELYGTLGDARDVLSVIALVTQALVVAAVMLAMLAAQAQRRRQLGVLRALGASRTYVFAAVWLQVTLIVACGGVVGLGLGWQGAAALSRVLQAQTGVALTAGVSLAELRLIAGVVVVGAALALVPACIAYRQSVSSLLRG
jgi:putative ABC transport system permease protein